MIKWSDQDLQAEKDIPHYHTCTIGGQTNNEYTLGISITFVQAYAKAFPGWNFNEYAMYFVLVWRGEEADPKEHGWKW